MSTRRRLKLVEAQARQLAKKLLRVVGKTRQQALFDTIEMLKEKPSGPSSSVGKRHRHEERFGVFTHAIEAG